MVFLIDTSLSVIPILVGILPSKPRLHNESKNKLTVRVLNIKKKHQWLGGLGNKLYTPHSVN